MSDSITAKNFKAFYDRIYPYLNGAAHAGFTPVGTVISVMGKTAPQNYLVCDGSVYNIADYPELAAYFKEQFESSNYFGGDGTTTFAVPDLQGEFLRGAGTNSHSNQGSGGDVGEHQDGTLHIRLRSDATNIIWPRARASQYEDFFIEQNTRNYVSGTAQTDTMTGLYTSRPTNTSVLYCIAVKNIYVDARFDYSTEEKVVGTWIDGKTLYQKTIVDTMPTVTTEGTLVVKNVAIEANVDTIAEANAMMHVSGTGNFIPLMQTNDIFTENGLARFVIASNSSTNSPNTVILRCSRTLWSGIPVYVTLRYTKTS